MTLEEIRDVKSFGQDYQESFEVYKAIDEAIAERDALKGQLRCAKNLQCVDHEGQIITQGAMNALFAQNEQFRRGSEELKATVAQCVEALRDLHDWQNGPPLATYAVPWRAAMDMAEELLELYEVV